MLEWALSSFTLTLISSLFAFTDLAKNIAPLAKITFFLCLSSFVLALITAALQRRTLPPLVKMRM